MPTSAAFIDNEQGLRPDEIAQKLGLSTYTRPGGAAHVQRVLAAGLPRFLKTLGLRHGELGRDNLAGLAPDVAAALTGTAASVSAETPHAIA